MSDLPADNDFVPIKTYSNWCHYDCYGPPIVNNGWASGCDQIQDGDEVLVQWPDGSESDGKMLVEKSSYETIDMGHPTTIPVRRATIVVTLDGKTVHVPRANNDIRVKVTKRAKP